MPSYSYLDFPYVPNRQGAKMRGRVTPYGYLHRIAYTLTMRGANDNTPALLFYGAPFALLKDVCTALLRMMGGRLHNLIIDREHSCRWRNGKCFWRLVIRIDGLDQQFMSLEEFVLLLVSKIKKTCNCTIKRYKLDTFINL